MSATLRRRTVAAAIAALCCLGVGLPSPASAAPAPRWVVGFGSVGPVTTRMTVAQAIAALHSTASGAPADPYCAIYGLSARTGAGLYGVALRRGGRLDLLSVGFLFGGGTRGLPRTVETAAGVHLGTSLARLEAAYPHRLRRTTDVTKRVEILPGPKGLAIAFEIASGKVANIATGVSSLLVGGDECG